MLKYSENRYWWKGPAEQVEAIKALGFTWDKEGELWCTKRAFIADKLSNQAVDTQTLAQLANDMVDTRLKVSASSRSNWPYSTKYPCPEGLEFLPFQQAGIEFIVHRYNTILADDMGLGKTIQAIGAINVWNDVNKILIVCPANVKLQWRDMIKEWCTKYFDILVVDGQSDERVHDPNNEIVIMSYDVATYYKKLLAKTKWDLKIVDEFHYLMTPESQRTKAILGHIETLKKKVGAELKAVLGAKSKYNLFLSGSPGEKPYELWPTLYHLDPYHFDSFWRFVKRYCDAKVNTSNYRDKESWDFSGAANLDELQYSLRSTLMIRRLKSQVMPQLGEKTKTIIPLDLSKKLSSYLIYEKHVVDQLGGYDSAVSELSTGALDDDENMARARRGIGLAKLPLVIDFMDNILRKKDKIVCFAWHRDVIAKLAEKYGKACVVVNGATSPKKKEQNKRRFIEDPSCKIYIGQIKSAGTGVDGLQGATDTAVYAEIDWSFKNMEQSEDRLHRHGQKGSAMYYYPVVDGSLESHMAKRLQIKKSNHKDMFDGVSNKI